MDNEVSPLTSTLSILETHSLAEWVGACSVSAPILPRINDARVSAALRMMHTADPKVSLLDEITALEDRYAFYDTVVSQLCELTGYYRVALKTQSVVDGYGELFCEILAFSIRILMVGDAMLAPARMQLSMRAPVKPSPLRAALTDLQAATEAAVYSAAEISARGDETFGAGVERLAPALNECVHLLGATAKRRLTTILRENASVRSRECDSMITLRAWAKEQN